MPRYAHTLFAKQPRLPPKQLGQTAREVERILMLYVAGRIEATEMEGSIRRVIAKSGVAEDMVYNHVLRRMQSAGLGE